MAIKYVCGANGMTLPNECKAGRGDGHSRAPLEQLDGSVAWRAGVSHNFWPQSPDCWPIAGVAKCQGIKVAKQGPCTPTGDS